MTVLDQTPATAIDVAASQTVVMGVAPAAHRPLPLWLVEIVDRINELSHLTAGWDSRTAQPITGDAARGALNVLRELMWDEVPVPVIAPNPDGGIVIEWVAPGLEMIIEVRPTGSAFVSITSNESEWEGDWPGCRSAMRDLLAMHSVKSWRKA